jgi:DNA modification methylase
MTENLTNEEKKVGLYLSEDKPIQPVSVTRDTPLESLNLNWGERDLPERERTKHVHRLHPYLGKYIPQLVEVFLRKYFLPGDLIFDPFMGSGTTLVQANELGINSIGSDVSAFNVILSTAKTAHYDIKRVRNEAYEVLKKTKLQLQNDIAELPLFAQTEHVPNTLIEANDYLRQWYAPQALRQLIAYRDCVESGTYLYKDLLRVILSRSARSARLTTHFDLDFPKRPQTEPYWCYKHSRICQPTADALQFLNRYTEDTVKRVEAFAKLQTDATVEIYHGDSRTVDLPLIDGVVTSPPYVGLIDYHEQHIYAYQLFGLEDKRLEEIGAAAAGTSKRAKTEYQTQIAAVFQNALSAMKSGGRLIIVAGDKDNLYPSIAEMLNVEEEAVVQRHVNRRTGRRSGEFYESIFIWRKK